MANSTRADDLYNDASELMDQVYPDPDEARVGGAPYARRELEQWLFGQLPEEPAERRNHLLGKLVSLPNYLAAMEAQDEALDLVSGPGVHKWDCGYVCNTARVVLLYLIPLHCPDVMRHADYRRLVRQLANPGPGSVLHPLPSDTPEQETRKASLACVWIETVVLALNEMNLVNTRAAGFNHVVYQMDYLGNQNGAEIEDVQLQTAAYIAIRMQDRDLLEVYLALVPRDSIDGHDLVQSLSLVRGNEYGYLGRPWAFPADAQGLRRAVECLRLILVDREATYWTWLSEAPMRGTHPAVRAMMHRLPTGLRHKIAQHRPPALPHA